MQAGCVCMGGVDGGASEPGGLRISGPPGLDLGGLLQPKSGGATLSLPRGCGQQVPGNSSTSCQAAGGCAPGLAPGTGGSREGL